MQATAEALHSHFPPTAEPSLFELESAAELQAQKTLTSLGCVASGAEYSLTPGLLHETDQNANNALGEASYLVPLAARVQDLPEESTVQADFIRGLGSLTIGSCIEAPVATSEVSVPTVSLLDQLEWAANGDRRALEENVSLALVEALLSEGVNEVRIEINEDGEFSQGGHRLHDVLKNTIEMRPGDHPALHEATRIEALGLSTMKTLEAEGYFDKGYVWVVPRMVPQGVPARALREYGYFENLAVSWGIVWKDEDGSFVTRTLFTAGVDPLPHEEIETREMTDDELDKMMDIRLARRHDIAAVSRLYEHWGVPVPETTVGFQRGVIRHKSEFDYQGEFDIDIARDNDEMIGPGHFFGRQAPKRDYVATSRESIRGMRDLDTKRDLIVEELLSKRHEITDPMAAAFLLAKTARKHAIDHVIDNPQIDAGPLGRTTVRLREEYQEHIIQGDIARAEQLRREIHRVARVNTCGYSGGSNEAKNEEDNASSSVKKEDDDDAECAFESEECPICKKKNVWTVVTKTHITGDCGCSVKK